MSDIYKSVIAGNDVELNDSLFAEIQKTFETWAQTSSEKNNWTTENNFGIDDLPMVGGKFSK